MFNAAGVFPEEKLVNPRARRDSSSEPALSNFFRISSSPPSLAREFVVTVSCASVASPCEGCGLTSCRSFFNAGSRTRRGPILSPSFPSPLE